MSHRYRILPLVLILGLAAEVLAVEWPDKVREIHYTSQADGTEQPALFYAPDGDEPVPLLVVLHSWSSNYRGGSDGPTYAPLAIKRGWVFIHPDFRGPNKRPEAGGSQLVINDILSAVDYAKAHANIDPVRVYLAGGSGGGHASLLVAARSPETWTAVSAWVPITDLAAWHSESKNQTHSNYWRMLEGVCGGPPGASAEVDEQYRVRSPLTWLDRAANLPLDINAGIHDGHTGSVPVSHSLRAFNKLARPEDRIDEDAITMITSQEKIPPALQAEEQDPTYGDKQVLLRRESNQVRLTLFEGTHETIPAAAVEWLARHKRNSSK